MRTASRSPRPPTARPRAPTSCSASSSAREWGVGSSWTAGACRARTSSPVSGGTIPFPGSGPTSGPVRPGYCGKRGCVETWLSGPALARDHAEHTGLTLPAREIARAAVDGDPGAAATLARYHDRLGRALASLINVLDPDVVVLGGGMSNIAGLPEAAYAALPRYLFAAGASAVPVATRVVRAAHGDSSGVRGAAWLWPARE